MKIFKLLKSHYSHLVISSLDVSYIQTLSTTRTLVAPATGTTGTTSVRVVDKYKLAIHLKVSGHPKRSEVFHKLLLHYLYTESWLVHVKSRVAYPTRG